MRNLAAHIDTPTLKKLKPLDSLDDTQLLQLSHCAQLHRLQPGEILSISPADATAGKYIDYLVSGDIELRRDRHHSLLSASSQQALRPLGDALRDYTSIVPHTSSAIMRIEKQRLEDVLHLHWDQVFECEELHVESDMHSMAQLLQNRCLLALPPDNIETVLALMETVEASAGQTIIRQGERDDGYYTLLNGRCKVTRRPHPLARDILLAELGAGASFGEEALISDAPRNASIQMLTDGNLMRLEKKYFLRYVVDALTTRLEYGELIERLRSGSKLIDVRNVDEYRRNGHGLHIPLPMLRLRLEKLSKGREYIFSCNDGKLSTTAAFLATQQGFRTAVLDGGLDSVPKEYLRQNR